MSGTGNDFQNGAPFYLDATQQDLLLAALASNNQNPNDLFSDMSGLDSKQSFGNDQFQYPANNLDPSTFSRASSVPLRVPLTYMDERELHSCGPLVALSVV